MYNWSKFKHSNTKGDKYNADCQVVTAVNAYYFLTGRQVEQDHESLCELARACYGSAIYIEKVHEELGLETFDETKFKLDILSDNEFKIIYPIEMSVYHPKYGFHSTLIVERDIRCHAVRVVNFSRVTTSDGWLWEEDLNFYLNDVNKGWALRKFKLKENHELYQ